MNLHGRLEHMLLGAVVGFVLGVCAEWLRNRNSQRKVTDNVMETRDRDETGIVRYPLLADFMFVLVLGIVVWGAFAAQRASNEVEEAQNNIARVTECNQEYLAGTIEALNQRTTYTQDQAALNVELQKAQAQYLGILLEIPPPTSERAKESLAAYFDALSEFVDVNAKARVKSENYPYPTTEDYDSCVAED